MSKVSDAFNKHKAFITFITAGDPSLSATEKLIYGLEKSGADIIELGIPFSDPLADGPVIQASHLRALKNDVSLSDVFALVKKVRLKTQIPLIFMLSDNLVEKYGSDKFYSDCKKVGVDGVIIPDKPVEEVDPSKNAFCDTILLVAPTSGEERIKLISEKSSGFIYLVSTLGVTGKRVELSGEISNIIAKIKKYTGKPVAVGFGIGSPAQAADAAKYSDGVIVGSAIVDLIGKKKIKQALKLVENMRKAIDA